MVKIPEPDLGLTDKQKLACIEYLVDLDKTNALKRAHYSVQYAENHCSAFFAKPKIRTYLDWYRGNMLVKEGMTPEEVLRRLTRIATAAERDDELPSALRALELIGKHFAMFTDKQQIQQIENPWATGDNDDAIKQDVNRMLRAAAPKLKVVNGDKKD